MVAAAYRTVFAQLTPAEIDSRYDEVADQLEARFPKAAASMRAAKADVLAFTPFPFDHWRKVWSNNPLERLNKEIKGRTNVVGIFPSDQSALRIAAHRGRPRRPARRVDHRPPLPLRSIHGAAQRQQAD